ncbi:hypothetical protein [Paenibacillus sp. V4I7]|uniref:hypothetical protein n=1 Tax=Paenibacillus sp. V4I7 TaxID=3042307 RepID=UPI002782A358|nr:hypothetical protein [Paenibacillus sp. V4I7]MDQ0902033.1 hypothetical protein [Paenibacillus sp. V4I7]
MLKLILPVVISLVLSLIYIIKFNKNHKSVTIISVGAVINMVCLLLGIVYFVLTSQDGLAVVGQMGIYAVCFVVILLINVNTVIALKKRKI